MSVPEDGDIKIALLVSLLEPATYPISEYIDAIAAASGDVAKAAEALLLPRVKSVGKRKAGTSIDSWLGRKTGKTVIGDEHHSEPPVVVSRTPSSPSKVGPPVDLLSVLRQSSPTKPLNIKSLPQPALLLTSQASIDSSNVPVTLLPSPLSPSLASALYLALMEESEQWERNRWFLAGKWVESPHTTTVYARKGDGYGELEGEESDARDAETQKDASKIKSRYYYSGTELSPPKDYPILLRQAADLIEPVVDAAIRSRRRYPFEWAGDWKANVCGANRYDGASSGVGWHADQLTYLGPYPTIASLSLGTPRAFRLRQTDPVNPSFATHTKPIRTYEVNLGHNSLCLMNAGCQERFKHTVPPQKALDLFRPGYDMDQRAISVDEQTTYRSRINITFRFYREDFHPKPEAGPSGARQGTPLCNCGLPALLRADQKAKARSRLAPSPSKSRPCVRSHLTQDASPDGPKTIQEKGGPKVMEDDMVFFWQCQSPGQTGDLKGCGFFRILDMKAEGRGPCVGD